MTDLLLDGPQRLDGTVRVSGAKNSATKLLAAATLAGEPVTLRNFPTELVDVQEQVRFMSELGVRVALDADAGEARLSGERLGSRRLPGYGYHFRITYLLVPGQLLSNSVARIPYPGGCPLGERRHDLHAMIWERMGATVRERDDHIEVACPAGLRGADVDLPISTVGGTETAILCGAVAAGATVVRNAYLTPEVEDLIAMLRVLGADIEVVGHSLVRIEGRPALGGAAYRVMPDRIEATTWMIAAAVTRGQVLIRDVPFADLSVPLVHLREAGIDLFRNQRDAYIAPACISAGGIQPFEMACGTHPGVHTDMQPLFVVLAMCAEGNSRIIDYRYPERTAYLEQLRRACRQPDRLAWDRGEIRIRGPVPLVGARLAATDLRGTMAIVLAGLLAEGRTRISGVEVALRGYNRLLDKLAALGAVASSAVESAPSPS